MSIIISYQISFELQVFQRGVHIRALQELLGHKTLAMTQRYSHLAPQMGFWKRIRRGEAVREGLKRAGGPAFIQLSQWSMGVVRNFFSSIPSWPIRSCLLGRKVFMKRRGSWILFNKTWKILLLSIRYPQIQFPQYFEYFYSILWASQE